MKWMWKRLVLLGALGLTAGGAVGCASERPPINQVQADALAKSFFVGPDLQDASDDPEFYFRNTVIDVGYGAAQDGLFTSTYAQPISRIRWEITEDYLNARLSYERIAGTDGKGNKVDGISPKATEDGQIVASYKISSQFDIRRAYNPSTGEEQNLIQENTTDRPWYEREYFRVDWSQNLVTDQYDFDTLSMMGLFGGITFEPLAYTVLDPNDPNAPHFDADTGYFDITNKAFATPGILDLSSLGWGINSFPACMLPGEFAGGTSPYGNCGPVEITLRESFRRVADTDYQPVNWDGYREQAIGAFTTERLGYDRNYGLVDADWYRFASRYNIWERSHYYKNDPEGMTDPVACGTTTTTGPTGDPTADPNTAQNLGSSVECEKGGAPAGSQCDDFKQKCTLPYELRKPVTIPWYINGTGIDPTTGLTQAQINGVNKSDPTAIAQAEEKAEDLFEATNWAVQEWDLAMKGAIQSARYAECRATNAANCKAVCATGACDAGKICGLPVDQACSNMYPMWRGQQEDIDDGVAIARDLDQCHRTQGWTASACSDLVNKEAGLVAKERGSATDFNAFALGVVNNLQPVIVLCHNPVTSKDHPACGAAGLAPRLGDIRYNTVLNIDKPQQPSAWGIMVDADDPLSGEKVAASINIWTHVTDLASQQLVDLVKYMNGELTTEEITDGTYVSNWVATQKLASGGANARTMSKAEVTKRLAAGSGTDVKTMKNIQAGNLPSAVKAALPAMEKALSGQILDVRSDPSLPSPAQFSAAQRMQQARNTDVESQLMNDAMYQLAGFNGSSGFSGAASAASQATQGGMTDIVSPFALGNPQVRSLLTQMRENALAANGACILDEAPEPSSLTAIAKVMTEKFGGPVANESTDAKYARWSAMQRYIRRKYHYAVLAHEMGHSVGLRHNFVSTYAAMHFRPQYWQLRTKNGKVVDECQDVKTKAEAENCVGPRYYDPLTDEEQDQMIWMFMQSTVMDYPGDVSQDTLGLGVFDFAAARLFYGDVVSLYDVDSQYYQAGPASKYNAGGSLGAGFLETMDNFGGLLGIQYQVLGSEITDASTDEGVRCGGAGQARPCNIHYSQLQKYYKLIHDCYGASINVGQPAWYNPAKDGKWNQVFDGHVVSVDGMPSKCRTLPVDYTFWNRTHVPTTAELAGAQQNDPGPSVENGGSRVRVPYAFSSDEWADLGNVSVFRHDNGADPYEQMSFLVETQEDRHIFDNYRRGRTSFNIRAAADRSYQRYNDKMYGIANGVGFISNIYKDLITNGGALNGSGPTIPTNIGVSFDTFWPVLVNGLLPDNVIGASVAFDHFARELSRPEPGVHYAMASQFNDPTLRSSADPDNFYDATDQADYPTAVVVPNGSTGYLADVGFGGHPLENALATNQGYYSVDYEMNAGSYYDKINSGILFSLSTDQFVSQSRQDFYDARFRSVGMADIFPDGYRRVIGNALVNDRSIMASHVVATNGKPELMGTADPRDPNAQLYPKYPIGWTSWWPSDGPQMCFPSNGINVCYSYDDDTNGNLSPLKAGSTVGLDPQIGWEVQKFIIAWTLAYIPADQQSNWLDMMRIYRVGENSASPTMVNRIEWQDPTSGELYYAQGYGAECLFGSGTTRATCAASGGKWVQKGIAARVLEYANSLTASGYDLDTANNPATPEWPAGFNGFGRAMVKTQPDGTPIIVADPALLSLTANGTQITSNTTCDQNVTPTCTPLLVTDNHYAVDLQAYKMLPDFLWETVIKYGLGNPDELGVFPD